MINRQRKEAIDILLKEAYGQAEIAIKIERNYMITQVFTEEIIKGPRTKYRTPIINALGLEMTKTDLLVTSQMNDGNADILLHNIRPNVGILSNLRTYWYITALCDLTIFFVKHGVTSLSEQITAVLPGRNSFVFTSAETVHILSSDNHLWVVDLSIKQKPKNKKIDLTLCEMVYRSFSIFIGTNALGCTV
ncbi:hypothetical protein A3Q56_06785 [Intoshia linei]|uniref:Uncharacterized protein n=1 Tax=Intoshia linei TaxID=1819745 RepID=A0A177AU40_9BILA|nr:hypothetical protein A3Q56_06785 [Intoshia linei]